NLNTDAVNGVNYNFGELLPAAPAASLSGTVYADANNNGIREVGEVGLGGVTLTLTGTDDLGHDVSLTTTTDSNGFYQCNGLQPGAYTVTEGPALGFEHGLASIGTVNGSPDGDVLDVAQLGNIALDGGNNGINYNFGEIRGISNPT